jgi:hypothetical protein
MSTRKLTQAVQNLFQQIGRLARSIAKGLTSWLLRGLLVIGRKPAFNRAGFVLPTTILLLLVVSVTVGSITYRTFTRTNEAINERLQRVIYNAATPAIDRAKAKLEFMFDVQRDPRYPGGVPRQSTLLSMMLNDGRNVGLLGTVQCFHLNDPTRSCGQGYDPYTFPDETRMDIANSSANLASQGLDNAWRYPVDLDGDGVATPTNPKDGWVAYSIIFQTPRPIDDLRNTNRTTTNGVDGITERSGKLLVRQGPLSAPTTISASCSRQNNATAAQAEAGDTGWPQDGASSANLRKNFQVDAFVLPNDSNGTISTLEFTQDRQILRGNKWGAWFRNDLEVFPGPAFNWNGAMHTEGNLIIGDSSSFTGYLISAPNSCFYTADASEVTFTDISGSTTTGVPKFQGQLINGSMKTNLLAGSSVFHLFNGLNVAPITSGSKTQITTSTDSVLNANNPADYAIDPVVLVTKGNSQGRVVLDPNDKRDPVWDSPTRPEEQKARLFNQAEPPPFVDDYYRADNRYGPGPKIDGKKIGIDIASVIGQPISTTSDVPDAAKYIRNEPPSAAQSTEFGLDGYWERRARYEGMRLIVGQRLELGDAFGWGQRIGGATDPKNEPLRPWGDNSSLPPCTTGNTGKCNEARQRRTLYDNLAAVQATAVYHSANFQPNDVDKDFPVACLATTVHHGTVYTLERSSTFNDLNYDFGYNSGTQISQSLSSFPKHSIISDFFHGKGTNGWEYSVPSIDNFRNSTSVLRRALKNLAYFAGDPKGGMPSSSVSSGDPFRQQDSYVHPLPNLAMWGDYSNLRYVIQLLDAGTSYDNLSPADKTTLHTAACTLGMLAHNIQYLSNYDFSNIGTLPNSFGSLLSGSSGVAALDKYIGYLITGSDSSPIIGAYEPAQNITDPQPEDIIAGLQAWQDNAIKGGASPTDIDTLVKLTHIAQMLATKVQVWRDSQLGFQVSSGVSRTQHPLCETGGLSTGNLKFLCSKQPRYPILYSIFPSLKDPNSGLVLAHGEKPDFARDKQDSATGSIDRFQEWDYIQNANSGTDVYQPIDINDNAVMDQIALKPRLLNTWKLPNSDNFAPGKTPNSNRDVLIRDCSGPCLDYSFVGVPSPIARDTLVRVAFKDSALFNGREMMSVRVMDVNLDLMRTSPTSLVRADYWLPLSGVIYAFREDSVSESNIVRPRRSGVIWENCDTNAEIVLPLCRMDTQGASAYRSTDPPLNKLNLITPKPVDYYADPDRRPNGFRLRNGIRLDRPNDTTGRGMSLVSDDPVYIQGDFNLHQDATSTSSTPPRLEEFVQPLTDNFSNFYTRTDLDPKFASPTTDRWRPAEILADAISILSLNFCDGSVEDVMLTAGRAAAATVSSGAQTSYNCLGNSNITSYLNIDGLKSTLNSAKIPVTASGNYWRRSDLAETQYFGTESTDPLLQKRTSFVRSPILFSQSGNPLVASTDKEYDGTYYTVNDGRPRNGTPGSTRINAIIVSGLVPSRPNQSYGGLHNFPRFLESWGTLYISGSFLQLGFSNYATAPFDQDAFEVGVNPAPAEIIGYYGPPNRRWGYDVGLQYAPAGPLAQRFISLKSIRSEFYIEPPADDPYIQKLCIALRGSVNPAANCS